MRQKLAILAITLSMALALATGCTTESKFVGPAEPGAPGEPKDVGGADIDTPDSAFEDVASEDDALEDVQEPAPESLSDYQRCFSDGDCSSGMGSCVKEVALNRVDASGATSVAIAAIFESLEEDEGVCTVVCTDSPAACDALSGEASSAAHTCQLIVEGERPYPASAPAFPFDDALNPAEQAAGQIFGAICRPPFELNPAVDAAFCATCEGGTDSCGADAICWSLLHQARAQTGETGTCLRTCDADNACALGFVCDIQDSDAQGYCRPVLDTCTVCRDLDGDGFGTGRCGDETRPVTPDDCDDRNPTAYFDPDNMAHAFPASCGVHDLNCNGQSDDLEQIGDMNFGSEHCASCYDVCAGEVTHGELACRNLGDLENPAPTCTTQCERDAHGNLLFADCDGDISNGCEVAVDDPSRQYYRDLDGDGYGDPNDVIFACDPSVVPAGYVDNALDCNDNSSAAHGGPNPPAEICDGIDNDCNGLIDDADPGVTDLQAFYRDNDGDGFGSSSEANTTYACQARTGYTAIGGDCNDTQPHINPGAPDLSCNNEDTNCDGIVDNAFPQKGNTCTVGLGVCQNTGALICNASQNNTTCSAQPGTPQMEVCDGLDNSCTGTIDNGCPHTGSTIHGSGARIVRGGFGDNDYAETGSIDREIICADNELLVGVEVYVNTKYDDIQAIDLRCQDLSVTQASATTYQYSSGRPAGNWVRRTGIGYRSLGAWENYTCPAGSAIRMMQGTHDNHVSSLRFTCYNYKLPTEPGPTAATSSITTDRSTGSVSFGNAQGSSHGPYSCLSDEAAVGLRMSGRSTPRSSGSDGLTKLDLICKKLDFGRR